VRFSSLPSSALDVLKGLRGIGVITRGTDTHARIMHARAPAGGGARAPVSRGLTGAQGVPGRPCVESGSVFRLFTRLGEHGSCTPVTRPGGSARRCHGDSRGCMRDGAGGPGQALRRERERV
jgi:hypothetical protein